MALWICFSAWLCCLTFKRTTSTSQALLETSVFLAQNIFSLSWVDELGARSGELAFPSSCRFITSSVCLCRSLSLRPWIFRLSHLPISSLHRDAHHARMARSRFKTSSARTVLMVVYASCVRRAPRYVRDSHVLIRYLFWNQHHF